MAKDESELIYVGVTDCPYYGGVLTYEKRQCSCPHPKTDAVIQCEKLGRLKGWQCRLFCEFYTGENGKEEK